MVNIILNHGTLHPLLPMAIAILVILAAPQAAPSAAAPHAPDATVQGRHRGVPVLPVSTVLSCMLVTVLYLCILPFSTVLYW